MNGIEIELLPFPDAKAINTVRITSLNSGHRIEFEGIELTALLDAFEKLSLEDIRKGTRIAARFIGVNSSVCAESTVRVDPGWQKGDPTPIEPAEPDPATASQRGE